MFRNVGRVAVAALAIATIAGQATAASNDCWAAQETSAAKVRDLQSMLMVAALRCRTSGVDVLASYNQFVRNNREALVATNSRLKVHFNTAYGPVEGQRAYDRFTTALANAYGAGDSGAESCSDMAELADYGALANGSATQLIAVAEQRGIQPELPTMRCPMTFAAK